MFTKKQQKERKNSKANNLSRPHGTPMFNFKRRAWETQKQTNENRLSATATLGLHKLVDIKHWFDRREPWLLSRHIYLLGTKCTVDTTVPYLHQVEAWSSVKSLLIKTFPLALLSLPFAGSLRVVSVLNCLIP